MQKINIYLIHYNKYKNYYHYLFQRFICNLGFTEHFNGYLSNLIRLKIKCIKPLINLMFTVYNIKLN